MSSTQANPNKLCTVQSWKPVKKKNLPTKERIPRGEEMEVHFIYSYKNSIMKPIKLYLKKGGENGNIMEGVNLFKVHCMCVWN
jgi:hypothetical protein